MAKAGPTNFTVEVGTEPLSGTAESKLLEVRIERALNQTARCVLRFHSTELDADIKCKPGTDLVVRANDPREVVFSGVLVAVEAEREGEASLVLTLVAYDKSYKLSGNSTIRTYLKMPPSEVVKKLVGFSGLGAKITAKAGGVDLSRTDEYTIQAGNDLDFLNYIAARTGADWWCDDVTIHFQGIDKNGTKTMTVKATELQRLSVRASAIRPDSVEVRGWNNVEQSPFKGEAKVQVSATGKFAAFAEDAWQDRSVVTSGLPAVVKAEAGELATGMAVRNGAAAVRAEGEGVGLVGLRPGMALEIADAKSLTGSYVVSEVRHLWGPGQAVVTQFVCGDRRPPVVPGAFAEGTAEMGGTYTGVMPAIVTSVKDEDKRGRVKVRFAGMDTKQDSFWARVVIPGAGKGRGSVALPEVDDEVLVGFEGGDLRKPVVFGGMFNSKSTIPLWQVGNDGKVAGRRWTSRLGHYFEMGDQVGQPPTEHLLLSLKDNKTQFRLDSKKSELLVPQGNPLTIKVGSTSSIVFDGKGKITIDCNELEIKTKLGIKGEGSQINFGAKAVMKLAANGKAELSGATTTVTGQGMLELKGGMVKIN